MSGVPVQSPASAVSVPPSATGPETPGVAVFCGACAATAGVGADAAVWVPPSLCAVTRTSTACPTSSGVAA